MPSRISPACVLGTEGCTLGGFLRAMRQERQLGMGQAAQAAGVHRATLYRWEQGEAQPRLTELQALLKALGVEAAQQRQALALMDAPRARKQVQSEMAQIAAQADLGPMPHGGELLRAMRQRRGFSLETVAARLGVTPRTLRRWERGDIWPPTEQLHALCYTLEAYCQEVTALTIGQFASVRAQEREQSFTPADLQDRFGAFHFGATRSAEEEALRELCYLSFKAQAWRLAAQHDSARSLLAEMYAHHANYNSSWERFAEASEQAERALEVGRAARMPPAALARAAIVGARGAVYRGERPVPQRGIERLRQWENAGLPPEFQAWLLSDLAKYLALAGHKGAALDVAMQARHTAAKTNSYEQAWRRLDQAQVLLLVGHTVPALEALAPPPSEYPRVFLSFALQEAETLLAAGDPTTARERLVQLLSRPNIPQWEPLWMPARTLAARLLSNTVKLELPSFW